MTERRTSRCSQVPRAVRPPARPQRRAGRTAAHLGLSQTQVAARMGTSQSAVARIETGSADVLLSTVDRYATALGQRLVWNLADGTDEADR